MVVSVSIETHLASLVFVHYRSTRSFAPPMSDISSTPSTADLAQDSSNVHNLLYFPFHGLAGCIRTTLVLSDQPYKFTNLGFAVLLTIQY